VIRVLQEHTLLPDERVVAPPGVDADAVDRRPGGAFHALLDLEPDAQDVPLQRSVLPDRLVDETVDLADVEDAGTQPAEHRAAALGSEIERQELSACSHRGFYGLRQLRPVTACRAEATMTARCDGGAKDTPSPWRGKASFKTPALFRNPEQPGAPPGRECPTLWQGLSRRLERQRPETLVRAE
jgi:hypothetical protein